MFIQDQGCLLRKADQGEHHLLLVFFLQGSGIRQVLARRSKQPGSGPAIPDLFETGELVLQQRGESKPTYLSEFHSRERFPGIARNYATLNAASQFARFIERNLLHMETFPEAWDLTMSALDSFSTKPCPDGALLKAMYLFARSEGYAVSAQWLLQLPDVTRTRIQTVLRFPLENCAEEASQLREWCRDLGNYFQRSTDLLPPDVGF